VDFFPQLLQYFQKFVEYIPQLLFIFPGVVEYIPQLFEANPLFLQVSANILQEPAKIKTLSFICPIAIGLVSNCYWTYIFLIIYFIN